MARARCVPDGVDVPVERGRTLLEAMLAAAVPVAHACGGSARCSTCRVRVLEGLDACEPRTEDEAAMAARLGMDDATRLACRTRVRGDLTLRRLVLDEVDLSLASQLGAAPGSCAVGREARLALLFADVADFTPLAESLPAYDVVHLLNRWFAAAGEAVARHGGRIDNYLGDGLFAVFGEDDVETAPERAALAGLALLDAADRVSRYTREVYGRAFAVRVGVHFGSAVVGAVGTPSGRRPTVIGDSVNVAARIESANKGLGTAFLVSDSVASRLRGGVTLGRAFEAELKGKTGTLRLHEVLRPADR